MSRLRRYRPTPAAIVSMVALFFAIGGSAFAIGERVTAAQPRCANGAVKGYAYITGDPTKGIANLPGEFSSNPVLFGALFNCTGKPVQVKKVEGGPGAIVKFVGISTKIAVATVVGDQPGGASVTPLPDGSLRVIQGGAVTGGSFSSRPELQFLVVVF